MASKGPHPHAGIRLTHDEAESLGIALPENLPPVPATVQEQELPLHEQLGLFMTEREVTNALTGDETAEDREAVADFFADLQEEEADRQSEAGPANP